VIALGIPIKIPNQEFQFSTINGEVYMRSVDTKNARLQFIGIRNSSPKFNDLWKDKFGEYEAVGQLFKCEDCTIMNMEKATLNLSEKNNFIYVELEGKSPDSKFKLYFDALDDKTLAGGGLGRGMTEKIKVLSNGNLFYQGFEFKKK
jgi:hypothetical protein